MPARGPGPHGRTLGPWEATRGHARPLSDSGGPNLAARNTYITPGVCLLQLARWPGAPPRQPATPPAPPRPVRPPSAALP